MGKAYDRVMESRKELTKQCGVIVYNDFCILQTDKCDEKSDTNRYCVFQVHRDGIENSFTNIGQ